MSDEQKHTKDCVVMVDGHPEVQLRVVIIEGVIRYRCIACDELVRTP